MDYYILSKKTQEDINDIYDFGNRKFGKDKALDYLIELKYYFQLLMKNPGIGKYRGEIKEGLYSFPYASHIVFTGSLKTISELCAYFTEAGIL